MKFYFTFILGLLYFTTNAQGFRVRHYVPGASANLSKAIFESTPGNYIAGGIIVDSLSGGNRLCVMGLDSQGQTLWTKKYGRNAFMYLDNPFISRSFYKQGNYLFYTTSVLDGNSKYIGVLIKFNLNGDTLWQRRFYDDSNYVYPQMVTGSIDNGLLITGLFEDPVNINRRAMLIKTDINGSELWRKKISKGVPNAEDGRNIIQDSATKKIVITGYQYIGNATSADSYDNVMILDSLGNLITRKNYIGAPGGLLLDMIQTRDKKIVAVGVMKMAPSPDFNNLMRAFAVKFDLNSPATAIWKIGLDQTSPANISTCLAELKNGDVLIAGGYDTQQLINLPENDLVRLVRITPGGVVASKKYYNYKINDPNSENLMGPKSVNVNSDGSVVAAIECTTYHPFVTPFFFVKWDSIGCDSSIAYCQMINNVSIRENKLNSGIHVSVYPNPTNGEVNISCSGTNSGEGLQLTVTDVIGSEIKKLILEAGYGNYKVNFNDLSNGVYLMSLRRDQELLYQNKLIKQE